MLLPASNLATWCSNKEECGRPLFRRRFLFSLTVHGILSSQEPGRRDVSDTRVRSHILQELERPTIRDREIQQHGTPDPATSFVATLGSFLCASIYDVRKSQ